MDGVDAGVSTSRLPPRVKVGLRALGNVLLGTALGLLAYYLVTDEVARQEQEALLEEAAELGPMGTPSPDLRLDEPDPDSDPDMDPEPEPAYTGWETWLEQDIEYWRELEDQGVFGRLVIEGMDLDAVVVRGVDREALKRGPGWMPYTDVPAQDRGNVGIAGHRTTYGAPFRRLDDLESGDIVYLYSPFRRYTYEVVEKFTVTPDEVEVVRTTEEPMLTLSACHPPYSAAYRLIVRSKLVDMQVLEEAPDESGS